MYIGKHVKKWYRVWRVIGPAGPEEVEIVLGRQEAEKLCEGCWDYEIELATYEEVYRKMNNPCVTIRQLERLLIKND